MSYEVTSWAVEVKTKSTSDKMVLVVLAHFHRNDTGACYPSLETIAEHSGLSKRSVIRCLKSLSEQGLIDTVSGNGRASNKYTIHCASDDMVTPQDHKPEIRSGDTVSSCGDILSRSGDIDACSGDTVTPKQGNKDNKVFNKDDRWDEFWSVYPKHRRQKKQAAKKSWGKLKPDEREIAIANVTNRAASDVQWLRNYIPLPTSYLNGKLWEDEWTAAEPEHDPNDTSWATREIKRNDDTAWAYASDGERSIFDHGGAVPAFVEGRRRNTQGVALPVGRILGGGDCKGSGELP